MFLGLLETRRRKPFVQGRGRCSSPRTAESGSNKPPELMNAITLASLKKLPQDLTPNVERRLFWRGRRNHWRKGPRTAILFAEWQTEIQNVVQKQN